MQVFNLYTNLLGPEHTHTLTSMNNLASTFSDQGQFKEAEKLQMQVLNLCRNILGPEHPQTLTSINNLAFIFAEQGKFEEAERLQMQVSNLHTQQPL